MKSEQVPKNVAFKNRKTGLVVFGIFLVICGIGCAISFLYRAIITIVLPVLDHNFALSTTNTLLFTFFSFGFTTIWLIWTGIGSIKARRWARTLILFSSWIYPICRGIGGFVSLFKLSYMYFNTGDISAIFYIVSLLTMIFNLIIPVIFILFYGNKNVKATCQFIDSDTRWNDKCPWLIPIVLSLFGVVNLGQLIIYGISWQSKYAFVEPKKAIDQKSIVQITAKFDWLDVRQADQFPSITVSGPLLVPTQGSPSYAVLSPRKVIDGDKYEGIKVLPSDIADEEKMFSHEGIFGLFVKTVKNESTVLDMYLNTKVRCELIIDNFAGGIVRFVETKDVLEEPYTLNAGKYHLEALAD